MLNCRYGMVQSRWKYKSDNGQRDQAPKPKHNHKKEKFNILLEKVKRQTLISEVPDCFAGVIGQGM